MSHAISSSLDKRGQLDVIYTDFSKAFDKVNHHLLLRKLAGIGFSCNLSDLIASYLEGRSNFVMINGYKSDLYKTTSGVPQGSTLGPLLFAVYINDVVESIKHSELLLFADDVKIFRQITSFNDCVLLQQDLDGMYNWSEDNNLALNKAKCKIVTYSACIEPFEYNYELDNYILERCNSIKDLGVLYDSQFSFKEHVDNLVANAKKVLGFIIRNCKEFSNIDTLKNLYFALVRTKLEYCALAWFPYYNYQVGKIENVQRRFLKYVYFKVEGKWPDRNYPQVVLLERFCIIQLISRRIIAALVFLFK